MELRKRVNERVKWLVRDFFVSVLLCGCRGDVVSK